VADPVTLVFCEVKTRTTDRYGSAAESVTRSKQARIRRVATRFLATSPVRRDTIRFDVACVEDGEVDVLEGVI
jgi:putative endonuclease